MDYVFMTDSDSDLPYRLKVACDILLGAFRQLLDTACSPEFEQEVRDLILSDAEVEDIDLLSTRMFGNKIYIDVEISCDGSLSLSAAHEIAERVHEEVEKEYSNTKHIMVHVNPAG